MKTEQKRWTSGHSWESVTDNNLKDLANLVFVFGGRHALADQARFEDIRRFYPNANILLGSTSGEIIDVEVSDDTIITTAAFFEHTAIESARLNISDVESSYQAGTKLASALPKENLVHVFVLSEGLKVNGSELVKGLNENLPAGVGVTGGLAGDGARFEKTVVGINASPDAGNIVALGFYGDKLRVGYGSMGGWDPFGPERKITKSSANVLYEMDGQPALALYKKYLGDQAKDLPGSGLLFPLSIRTSPGAEPIVRTILAVDEASQSLTFAGDIPVGAQASLMKANFDKLIDGASSAAGRSYEQIGSDSPDLAILISCVGRKLILSQRIEEEVESVKDVLGDHSTITGFYSYGEISPFTPNAKCELHNQTMTITTFSERNN